MYNKRKIVNDPVYGFINIPNELLYDIISHPYFQRLRRIKQLGLTHYVYPGATHTRFEHVLGATHLMSAAIKVLRSKNNKITKEEEEGALIAILMHDMGHGPFSHTLEHSFVSNISHEEISLKFMELLNKKFKGRLSLGIEIFKNNYKKKFLHSLVSSQLDTDRLDYLKRDSFFTGVTEGIIGSDRIIKMLNVIDDEIVIEEKGIYSVEKFLIARRIMYWQVYLHKTVVSAELMLLKVLERARELIKHQRIYTTPGLSFFLENNINDISLFSSGNNKESVMSKFAAIDDSDVMISIKEWTKHQDKVLSALSNGIINRDLFRVEIQNKAFDNKKIDKLKNEALSSFGIEEDAVNYLVFSGKISNKAYSSDNIQRINILLKNNKLSDIAQASDIQNISALSETVEKYFLCYPKKCKI